MVLTKAVLLRAHPAGISVIFLPMLQENVDMVKTGAEGVGGVSGGQWGWWAEGSRLPVRP